MPSMLDALAAEAREITDQGLEAVRLGMEALRRSTLLNAQLEQLAKEQRANPTIAADADDEEFALFVAEHFPQAMLDQNTIGDAIEEHSRMLDALRSRYDVALDLYALTNLALEEIAQTMALHLSIAETYVRFGRQRGDVRAARGDLKRASQEA